MRSGLKSSGRDRSAEAGLAYAVGFMALIILSFIGGGSSRADVLSSTAVRLVALVYLTVCVLTLPRVQLKLVMGALLFPAILALVITFQLIPLPPGLWGALPGHDRYNQFIALGIDAAVWRPLTLTPDMTINALLSLLPPIGAICGAILCRGRQRAWCLRLLLALAIFSAMLGLAQVAHGDTSPLRYYAVKNESSPVGLFANRNHNALFLVTAILLLAQWASMPGRALHSAETRRWIAICGGVFFAVCILMTGSRAGALCGFAATGGACWLYLRNAERSMLQSSHWGKRFRISIGIVCIFILSLAILLLIKSATLSRLAETDLVEEQRFIWLPMFIDVGKEFFPFGSGFGSFDTVFRSYEPFYILKTTYINEAHNDLVQIFVEGGAIGLLLLLIYLVWWTRAAWTAWREGGTERAGFARLGSLVTGIMMVASLFDYPLRTPALAVLFAIGSVWMLAAQHVERNVALPDEPAPLPRGDLGSV